MVDDPWKYEGRSQKWEVSEKLLRTSDFVLLTSKKEPPVPIGGRNRRLVASTEGMTLHHRQLVIEKLCTLHAVRKAAKTADLSRRCWTGKDKFVGAKQKSASCQNRLRPLGGGRFMRRVHAIESALFRWPSYGMEAIDSVVREILNT